MAATSSKSKADRAGHHAPTAARPSRLKEDNGMSERSGSEVALDRRKFLAAASTGIVGSAVAGSASADTLADVPAREPGADRAQRTVEIRPDRPDPRSGTGQAECRSGDAINSKAPLEKLVGEITPSDLHYERSHSGAPDLDPSKHRLLVHGMARNQLVFRSTTLKAMPSVSRIVSRVYRQRLGKLEEGGRKSDGPEHAWTGQHQ